MNDAAILAAIAQGAFTATYDGSRRDEYVRVLRSYVQDFGGTLDESSGRLLAVVGGREVVVTWR